MISGCTGSSELAAADSSPFSAQPPVQIVSDDKATGQAIRFLEERLKSDPEDFSANSKLAGLYLQKLRETGDAAYLDMAFRAARASLASVPEERNTGGLAALALAEFASHEFTNARDHALRLAELDPRKSYPQGILGDALIELGEYEQAEIAYKKIVTLDGGISHGSETRFARLAQLKGDNIGVQKHFATALKLASNVNSPSRETVAWLHWQLGETAFAVGNYETAEQHFRDSLTTYPDYFRAVASMGRVRAAQNDLTGAIGHYEKAISISPDPHFIATLGDLYKLAGRAEDAKKQYELAEKMELDELSGGSFNRHLALFYADHDLKPEEAYDLSASEYKVRRDIYGADALAWTALKAGKLDVAQAAIQDALRLKTEDAKLFYHAGMIARASGDLKTAHNYLQRAIDLNPHFDLVHSGIVKAILDDR